MTEAEKNITKKNIVKIVYGEGIEVSGVDSVVSVEPTEIVLKVPGNVMVIKGKEFNVEKLIIEQRDFKASGKVVSLCYADKLEKQGFVKRVFK